MHSIEVLSPAGSFESLTAAVRSGCDAVYLGGALFNARRNADNFNTDTLKQAVEYCHKFSVKVYFTVNVSVHDNELDLCLTEAKTAAECGVDAFIVADLGLARALKHYIPNIPLHGSTQMSVSSAEALPILKELGFTRIVVAREMSRSDLEQFCARANEYGIEVEVFVHGALCMCLSGQCYMSAFLGSRSGNRGLCAGPCRLPFKSKNSNGYDLSLKDLSLLDHIDTLIKIGVKSLKIEGRMKRPEYVAASTAAARSAVDNGFVPDDLKELLRDVFSRSGFTDGYFTNNVDFSMFGIRTKEDAVLSNKVQNQIHSIYRAERQSVKISAKITLAQNTPAALAFSDGTNTVTAFGDIPQVAKNKPADYDYLQKQLSKLGGTPYILDSLECNLDSALTLPAAALNNLRRTCAELLSAKRAQTAPLKTVVEPLKITADTPKNPLNLKGTYARFDSLTSIPQNLQDISGVILPLDTDFSAAAKITQNLFLEMPRAFVNKQQVLKLLKAAAPFIKGAFCHTLAAIQIVKDQNIPAIGGFGLNVYNSHTAKVLENLNLNAITVSFETKAQNSNSIVCNIPKGAVTYGKLPLMIFKNCPVKANIGCNECGRKSYLTDRMGDQFPLRCRLGYTELYNSRELYLADVKNSIESDFNVLYFTTETEARVQEVIDAYKNGTPSKQAYTRGLYTKGVI